jgi:uncharacterized membrane protein YuzA (DUF378 family)
MKALRQNAAGIFVYMLLSMGALSWGLFSLHGIDLVTEPFGSLMVFSRTILSLTALAVVQQVMRQRVAPACQPIRVRARGGHG